MYKWGHQHPIRTMITVCSGPVVSCHRLLRPCCELSKALSMFLLCLNLCISVARPLIRACRATGQAEPAAKGFTGTYTVPEQQPEGPLGIENAKSGGKESPDKHSGHGRLYRPQATLARPPASGEPSSLSAFAPKSAGHTESMQPSASRKLSPAALHCFDSCPPVSQPTHGTC